MFIVGIVMPTVWIAGAVMLPTQARGGSAAAY
jgi:hypothetical protein